MTQKLKQTLEIDVELDYDVIDPKGAVELTAVWVVQGKHRVDIIGVLGQDELAALTDCCAEDLIEREESAYEAAMEARREAAEDDDWESRR